MYPTLVVIDIKHLIAEFILTTRGPDPVDANDLLFVEEVITSFSFAFFDIRNFHVEITNTIHFYTSEGVAYNFDMDDKLHILPAAIYALGTGILEVLKNAGAFHDGYFPYVFKRLVGDDTLFFEYDHQLVGNMNICEGAEHG